jgi:hypothetical protein
VHGGCLGIHCVDCVNESMKGLDRQKLAWHGIIRVSYIIQDSFDTLGPEAKYRGD